MCSTKDIGKGDTGGNVIISLGRICVVSPCGDAFVYSGLYLKMSCRALRHRGPLSGQCPGLQQSG